MKGDKNIKVV